LSATIELPNLSCSPVAIIALVKSVSSDKSNFSKAHPNTNIESSTRE